MENNIIEGIHELVLDTEMLKFCKNNPHYEAKRLLILYKLSRVVGDESIGTPIDHLQKGLEIMESESITEETISILFNFSQYYHDRGNLKKATEYGDLYFEILEYIINNLKTDGIKDFYLKNNRVKNYLNNYKNLKDQK